MVDPFPPRESPLGDFARLLEVDAELLRELIGDGWRVNEAPVWHDYDADPSGGLDALVTPWHITGSPAQLMIRVFAHGVFLALPEAYSPAGTWDLLHRPGEEIFFPVEDVRNGRVQQTVTKLLRRRRSSFHYCRYCRNLFPPEHRVDESCCEACAGLVH